MAKIEPHIKESLSKLPRKDLEKLVIKAATSNKQFHDFLILNLDEEYGESDLFEKAKADIRFLFYKGYKGYSSELRMANMLAACNKRISEFDKISKDKSKVLDLIMMVLDVPFSEVEDVSFSTCFTRFNYQVCLLLRKAITISQKKIHEDYHIQYAPTLNEYLQTLHKECNYLDYVFKLPGSD